MNCGSLVNATSLRHSQCVLQLARAAAAGVRPSITQITRHAAAGPRHVQQQFSQQHVGHSSRQLYVCAAVAAAEPASANAVAQEVRACSNFTMTI
jgi:hypothetical protein